MVPRCCVLSLLLLLVVVVVCVAVWSPVWRLSIMLLDGSVLWFEIENR